MLNVKNWKILILLIYSFGSNSSFPILFSLAINKTKMDENVLSSLKNDDIKSLTKKSYDKIVPKISSFHKKKMQILKDFILQSLLFHVLYFPVFSLNTKICCTCKTCFGYRLYTFQKSSMLNTLLFTKISSNFHLILLKHTVFAEFHVIHPKLWGNCAFLQNFHTRKLGEAKLFFTVQKLKNY